MPMPPQTSEELYAMSSAYALCCNDAMKTYIEGKRKKMHPRDLKPAIDQLESCASATKLGVDAHCADQYAALKECMTTNEKKWAKCSKLRETLEKCVVSNKLGELADK